ncbi:MAG: triose-phosphate isomerase [Candidatus Colwellbacteria bacterium RIFCSPHIGHO2_12_FULL_44_17]|uniref:Triosephosphate isomerase n=2 Tax=Candidatus Colwelliibacteriota TaxID=1817904 RepID=A0A1G1Z8Y6_9BACT|nr:MAG: triose-phosphate isomerase [Candidatus Colwellbacteria bacterium RIFCSPHIGHO2_12_FULL_44_17]OGY60889.1 MAG: triose-phosphate isomerase [Candidatus Colwellbacteria bacterium RIFCSPLOWO2_02_FULL_44_20b]
MKLIVANWKSNPLSEDEAVKLATATDALGVVLAPPYPFLSSISKVIKKAELGAQDMFWGDIGAYTGEISWHHLQHLNVRYVIVGHSERRKYLGETDGLINLKVKAALKAGLKTILCVGEPYRLKEQNDAEKDAFARNYVEHQLDEGLKGVTETANLIIAYEPIWAIGTGAADTPENTVQMAEFIKKKVPVKVLYGGSVTSENSANFLEKKEIDGALVGGASLNAEDFNKMVKKANK